ncbi:MAG: YolD-like family protein [Eubacterium sp.]|nr:YolD-like family protein [Eubacterium sp.]
MPMEERAKIFLPFAALKGYEEAIAEKKRITVEKINLSEEMKEVLDQQFQKVLRQLEQKQHPMVTVIYFEKDKNRPGEGFYLKLTGMVSRLDVQSRFIQVVNTKISFENIRSFSLEK